MMVVQCAIKAGRDAAAMSKRYRVEWLRRVLDATPLAKAEAKLGPTEVSYSDESRRRRV